MRAVLVAECSQFDAHQRFKRQESKRRRGDRFRDVRIGKRFVLVYFFPGKYDMDRIPHFGIFPVEKNIESSNMTIGESNIRQRSLDSGQVVAADQNIYVLSISNSGFVN